MEPSTVDVSDLRSACVHLLLGYVHVCSGCALISVVPRKASFEPIPVIIRNEGGDESAKIAGLNYVMRCVGMYKKGFTFRGVPFVSFNSWTLRYEYLYVKKQFKNAFLS